MASNIEVTSAISKVPGLTGVNNFFAWRRALEPLLLGFRALDVVEGIELCPTRPILAPTPAESKAYEAWKDRDAKAMSYIQQTISAPMYAMIKSERTSAAMWSMLGKLNNLHTSEHRATINTKVCNLFLDESGDMTEHLTNFVELVAEAEAAGLSWGTEDREKANRFLDTLPHSLRVIKTEWRAQPESERTFFSLIQLYNEEETARKRSADRTAEATAMSAFHQSKSVKIKGVAKHKGKPYAKKPGHNHGGSSKQVSNNKNGNTNSNNKSS